MTETEQAAAPAVPEPPHETLGQRFSDVFHREAPAVLPAAGQDLAALVRAHAQGVLRAVASALEKGESSPEVRALLPELVPLAESAARMILPAL